MIILYIFYEYANNAVGGIDHDLDSNTRTACICISIYCSTRISCMTNNSLLAQSLRRSLPDGNSKVKVFIERGRIQNTKTALHKDDTIMMVLCTDSSAFFLCEDQVHTPRGRDTQLPPQPSICAPPP